MAEQTTHTLPLLEEIPADDKWHIEDIFTDDHAFLAALSECRRHIDALSEFKEHLGDSAETFFTAMPGTDPMRTLPIHIIRISGDR